MAKLNPYLTFNGNCKEAMNFYKEILGGKLEILIVGETPAKDQMPAKYHNQVLHSTLKNDGLELMATDMVPQSFNEGNTVHLCLACKHEEEINRLFENLSAGGKVHQPLHQMFFGLIGTFTDKFGKSWILELDKPQNE